MPGFDRYRWRSSDDWYSGSSSTSSRSSYSTYWVPPPAPSPPLREPIVDYLPYLYPEPYGSDYPWGQYGSSDYSSSLYSGYSSARHDRHYWSDRYDRDYPSNLHYDFPSGRYGDHYWTNQYDSDSNSDSSSLYSDSSFDRSSDSLSSLCLRRDSSSGRYEYGYSTRRYGSTTPFICYTSTRYDSSRSRDSGRNRRWSAWATLNPFHVGFRRY